MVITDKKEFIFYSPKLLRCNLSFLHDYKLILQNMYTKCVYVLDVIDISSNNHRFEFNVTLPDCFDNGTYEYYIVTNEGWSKSDINIDIVKHTYRNILDNKEVITSNNNILTIGDAILVFSGFKCIDNNGDDITIEDDSEEILKYMCILNRGNLKYNITKDNKSCSIEREKTYKQYKAKRKYE